MTAAFSDLDVHLFNEGTHSRLADKLGAHVVAEGTRFSVWAPNAERGRGSGRLQRLVRRGPALEPVGTSGIWSGVLDSVPEGTAYKYRIRSRHRGYEVDKADPFAFHTEVPPNTASVVWRVDGYEWHDSEWMQRRPIVNSLDAPISIYEVHLGSWVGASTPRPGAPTTDCSETPSPSTA